MPIVIYGLKGIHTYTLPHTGGDILHVIVISCYECGIIVITRVRGTAED